MLELVQKEPAGPRSDRQPATPLSPLETEVIDWFVRVSRLLGQPRSLGEIFGLLFISARPLPMDTFIERLHLSKGSASQGLRFLREVGATRMVYVPGDRRVHYEAVTELRNLVTRFLRDRIVPQLDEGHGRLVRMVSLLDEVSGEDRDRVRERLHILQSWERNARRVLPVVARVLGK